MKAPLKTFIAGAMALSLGACGISPEERMERAEQAFEEHRFSEARLDLGILLQLDENDSQALDLLARIQLAMGQGALLLPRLAVWNAPASIWLMPTCLLPKDICNRAMSRRQGT